MLYFCRLLYVGLLETLAPPMLLLARVVAKEEVEDCNEHSRWINYFVDLEVESATCFGRSGPLRPAPVGKRRIDCSVDTYRSLEPNSQRLFLMAAGLLVEALDPTWSSVPQPPKDAVLTPKER